LEIDILIPGSQNLKEKRKIVKSLKDKVRAKFNVSICEVDFHEKWQRALIGISCVNSKRKEIEIIFEKIKNLIRGNGEVVVIREIGNFFYIKS
ncbi:MAG TPA: DUF503 domain-containing protein, partial [Firmicutes bacterium]|nr:DUF503 domain-containing protein [Bacillota bacterium]